MNLSREARAFSPSRSHEDYMCLAILLLFTRDREREIFRYISLKETQEERFRNRVKARAWDNGKRSSHVYSEWYNV